MGDFILRRLGEGIEVREGLCGERFEKVVLCGVRLWKRFWVA